jgi:chloramphenicol O-acetyltransferase type B
MSLIRESKIIVRYLLYRHHYKGSRVARETWISQDSTVGTKSAIHGRCQIISSSLGENNLIAENVSIHRSHLSKYVSIYSDSQVSEVSIDRFSYIARNSRLSMVKIGSFCSLGPETLAGTGNHPVDHLSTSPVFYSTMKQCGGTFALKDCIEERQTIEIGHDTWLGARVFIRDGVKIGNGAIVAAGSVVVKDVPDYAIVGGVPARIIRFRYPPDVIEKLLEIQWWRWSEAKLREAQPYFVEPDITLFLEWASPSTKTEDACALI